MRRLICLPYLRQSFPCRYWTLKSVAFSSSFAASYTVSIRQASVLPATSSGFHLAMDTLAARLTIPSAGFVEDFHLQMNAPCRAHNTKAGFSRPAFALGHFGTSLKLWDNSGHCSPRSKGRNALHSTQLLRRRNCTPSLWDSGAIGRGGNNQKYSLLQPRGCRCERRRGCVGRIRIP